MKHLSIITFFALTTFLFSGCLQNSGQRTDYNSLSAGVEDSWNAVIEIPAGSNLKLEFNPSNGKFEAEKIEGKERIVDFLPYPGNYGFIPSTLMDKKAGGDGDPLDVLVIASSVPTGTVLEVKPLGALILRDRGELDTKIIAVPADSTMRVINAVNTQQFFLEYDGAKRIIENWFLNYKGWGIIELVRWEDEDFANKEIKKWVITR